MRIFTLPALVALGLAAGCHTTSTAAEHTGVVQQPAPFATPPTLNGSPDVATLVARVKPAVVNITITKTVAAPVRGLPGLPGLEELFRHPGPNEDGESETPSIRQHALGSGIIVDREGHVVTNAHVIEGASDVRVKLADERELRAKVIGKDARLDLAVLSLENAPRDLPYASLGSSEQLRVGEYVVAIGNPFGLGHTVTMGIVSAKGRSLGAGPYDDFIQTDASINPGNSGGPLFDLHGQVIGINAAINPAGKGIGFAIPIDEVKQVLPELIAQGHVSRGQLGVAIQGIDADIARALGMDHPHGALVEEVLPHGAGAKAGLHAGDVILSVDGQDVPRAMDLPRMVASHAPGAKVRLRVFEGGHDKSVDATLDAFHEEAATPPSTEPTREPAGALGLSVRDEGGHAVVTHVAPDGPADGKLAPGDVIEEVDRQPVASAEQVKARLAARVPGAPVLLKVRHGDHSRFLALAPAS